MVRDTLIIAELKAIPDLKKAAFNFDGYGFDKRHPLFMLVFRGQISHGLIGAMISTVGFIGIASAIQDVTYDRYLKIREIIVTMPVHPISYMVGAALAPLLFASPRVAFFMALMLWLGCLPINALAHVIVILLLRWTVLSALEFVISTYIRKASIYTR